MSLPRFLVLASSLGLLFVTTRPAMAAENWIYVSNHIGSDTTGDGTREKPFATVVKALESGPAIRLLPNSPLAAYPEIRLSGAMTDLPYQFEAEEGPLMTRITNFVSEGSKRYTLTGLTISAPSSMGIQMESGDNATINNCAIIYCASNGILVNAFSTAVIINSLIYANEHFGIYVNTPTVTKIVNCMILNNAYSGARTLADGSVVSIRYCRVSGNGFDPIFPFTDIEGNFNVVHPITIDPTFVSPSGCDFRLMKSGPGDPGLFHLGDPTLKNPDGSRCDPGPFGGPLSGRWFVRGAGTRPSVGSIAVNKSDDPSGKLKVKVTIHLQD